MGVLGAPLDVFVGEFSGRGACVVDEIEGAGTALTIDLLPAEWGGLHFQGDFRHILFSRRWRRVFVFLPCTHLAYSGSQYHGEKVASGATWFALALCVLCFSAVVAEMVIMENSHGLLELWCRADQTLHPHQFGTGDDGRAYAKSTPIWRRGAYHDVIATDQQSPPFVSAPHATRGGKARSISDRGLVRALVEQYPAADAVPHEAPIFTVEIARAAAAYRARFGGHALPEGWCADLAMAPSRLEADLGCPSMMPDAEMLEFAPAMNGGETAVATLEVFERCNARSSKPAQRSSDVGCACVVRALAASSGDGQTPVWFVVPRGLHDESGRAKRMNDFKRWVFALPSKEWAEGEHLSRAARDFELARQGLCLADGEALEVSCACRTVRDCQRDITRLQIVRHAMKVLASRTPLLSPDGTSARQVSVPVASKAADTVLSDAVASATGERGDAREAPVTLEEILEHYDDDEARWVLLQMREDVKSRRVRSQVRAKGDAGRSAAVDSVDVLEADGTGSDDRATAHVAEARAVAPTVAPVGAPRHSGHVRWPSRLVTEVAMTPAVF